MMFSSMMGSMMMMWSTMVSSHSLGRYGMSRSRSWMYRNMAFKLGAWLKDGAGLGEQGEGELGEGDRVMQIVVSTIIIAISAIPLCLCSNSQNQKASDL